MQSNKPNKCVFFSFYFSVLYQQLPSARAPSASSSRHPLPGGMGGASGWAVNDSTPGLLRLTDRETVRGDRLGARHSPSAGEGVERGKAAMLSWESVWRQQQQKWKKK